MRVAVGDSPVRSFLLAEVLRFVELVRLHPYSRALLSSVLYPDPGRQLSRFVLAGEIPSPIHLPPGCHLHRRCPWAVDACSAIYPDLEEMLPGRRVACFRAREKYELELASPPDDGESGRPTGVARP